MASWTGTTPFATKKQLVSSVSGLITDLQDLSGFDFQNIQVSTLTAQQFISTPILVVSTIVGGGNVVINNISATTANFSLISISSLSLKGASFNAEVSFDLGLGDAIGGVAAGFGALVGGATIAVGTGVGLAVQGAEQGIGTIIAGRPQNFISQTTYETINFTTQLQVSTLGDAYPLYSSIVRTVSSVSANEVPGREIFISSFFSPGQICIRSVSDPFSLITGDSNLNTSTLQSFGQWVPLDGLEPENLLAQTLTLSNVSSNALLSVLRTPGVSADTPAVIIDQSIPSSNSFPFPFVSFANSSIQSKAFGFRDEYVLQTSFISTPFLQFQSTILEDIGLYFITSSISTPTSFTWSNTVFMGDFAICQPDETGFRSTATMDFIAQANPLLIQWGLLTDNRNSTIASGTGKRVTWDNTLNTSNFIDIPVPQSTLVNETRQQLLEFVTNPYEIQIHTDALGQPSQMAFNVSGATFGSNTTLANQPGYPYQFNGNLFVNGTIEAQTLIALSSIFTTSTFVDTQFSTQSLEAEFATILDGSISSLTANSILTTSLGALVASLTSLSSSQLTASNGAMTNLTVQNLVASNLVYSKAEAPTIQTSTIEFGWTGSFAFATPPQFSLSQTLTTEPGLVYNTFAAASNQILNIMNFSNTVLMLSQQFSTMLTDSSTEFNTQNVQGWASTIFFNNGLVGKQAILYQGTEPGEVSFQAQTNPVNAALNYVFNGPIPPAVTVPVGQTYKFTSDGNLWTTTCNAPVPGVIPYNNTLKLSMDFENTNLTTTDTLNITAEQINLNGVVNLQYPFLSNLYVDTFVSTSQVVLPRSFTGSLNSQSVYTPIAITNTVASTDFTNIRATVNPNRGFNAFNSVNVNEWNNTQFNIDVTASSGRPSMIVGDLIIKSPAPVYSGQFFINNAIDAPPVASNIAIQQNVNGVLSTIGFAVTGQYARVFTANGSNWSVQSNVPNPQGLGGYTYPNFYTMSMTSAQTVVQVGQPLVELTPTRTMTASKIILDCPSVRVNTMASPSFPSKESGFELSSYFDANVVFSGTESDAVNPIANSLNNYFFSVVGWSAQLWFGRIRTQSSGIQGFDIIGIAQLLTGTPGDFIWASQRYLNVFSGSGSLGADIREIYFMTPKNYHTPPQFVGQV